MKSFRADWKEAVANWQRLFFRPYAQRISSNSLLSRPDPNRVNGELSNLSRGVGQGHIPLSALREGGRDLDRPDFVRIELQRYPMRFPSRGQRCVVTDQRNRLTTDPGLGPSGFEHRSTLRSIEAAEAVEPDADSPGAPVYYEPTPLNAASEHKTLELETVKLSRDIDPRTLPTELKLRRPVLHVLPASDPNWPAPIPQFDSGWPPPETVVTTSQPPTSARRRSFIPLVLLVLLGSTLLLVLGATARRRSLSVETAQRAQATSPAAAPSPKQLDAPPSAPPALASRSESTASALAASASATDAPRSAPESDSAASAAPVRSADAPHHANFKPVSPSLSTANSRTPNAPSTVKPKRAIY